MSYIIYIKESMNNIAKGIAIYSDAHIGFQPFLTLVSIMYAYPKNQKIIIIDSPKNIGSLISNPKGLSQIDQIPVPPLLGKSITCALLNDSGVNINIVIKNFFIIYLFN